MWPNLCHRASDHRYACSSILPQPVSFRVLDPHLDLETGQGQ
jgi:hypothetical protein